MKIKPLGDRILVLGVEEEKKTKGGILYPIRQNKNLRKGKSLLWGLER